MEIFIRGEFEEIRKLFMFKEHEILSELPEKTGKVVLEEEPLPYSISKNKKITYKPVGRPSQIDTTLNYLENNPQESYSLPEVSEKTGLSTETLRNHFLELGYLYHLEDKVWRKDR